MIDGLIPVYLGDLDKSFDHRCLSYIVWQMKFKAAAAPSDLAASLTGPRIIDEDGNKAKWRKPVHLAILMDLGATAAFRGFEAYGNRCLLHYERPTGQASPTEPKRLCLNIRGHGEDTYPIIREFPAFETLFEFFESDVQPELVQHTEELRLETELWDAENKKWW